MVAARESIAASGTPFEPIVRFSVGCARSPGAGRSGCSSTAKEASAVCGPRPSTSAVTPATQNPAVSNTTSVAT